ncbi:MAG: protein-glutamate O-methyltransferase CheR [Candidatus Caenarcaniphilales bacterium]|nr:protein-glutamate O-methyltransferase CheR [Candidatus Caenarcaniphilales bacterium]
MTEPEFNKLSSYIHENYGIKLPYSKKTMLQGRLQKRLKMLNISSYKEYCDFIFSPEGQKEELYHMVDAITTNKTEFFREAYHFVFLLSDVLPGYIKNHSIAQTFQAWSAGCSSGEEPYTLGMILSEFLSANPGFNFNIFATDISNRALETAVTAVYTEERAMSVPLMLKKKYLLRSTDIKNKTVRIIADIRAKVAFQRLNLINSNIGALPMFNVIFCRNVLIYFDKVTQEKVIRKLCSKLEEGGYLFLGHSESITNMNLPLIQAHPTIFRKK